VFPKFFFAPGCVLVWGGGVGGEADFRPEMEKARFSTPVDSQNCPEL